MKRIIIVLLACATVALAGVAWIGGSDNNVSHAKAGKVATFTTPIVGGTEASPHSRPWMVTIVIDGSGFCGGVIIGNEWVLTSAQCVENGRSFEITAGVHNKNDPNESSQVMRVSTNKLVHGSYYSPTIQNDIALIRLPQPLSFDLYVQAINLDGSGNDWAGQVATLAGWGRSSASSSNLSAVLRQVQSPIITNAECADIYGSIITPGIGCTSGDPGVGACGGDTGGPVFIGNTLVGIMSFGAAAGCDAGWPTGFSRTSYFRDWIRTNTGI